MLTHEEQAVRVHVATGSASEPLADLALNLDAEFVVAASTGKMPSIASCSGA